MCTAVCAHLRVHTCVYTPVCAHLYVHTCVCTPVSAHLSLHSCLCTPVSVHLYVHLPNNFADPILSETRSKKSSYPTLKIVSKNGTVF